MPFPFKLPPALLSTGRYLLAGLLLYWIFRKIDLAGLANAYQTTARWTIPLVVLMTWTIMSLQAFRLWILVRAQSPDIRLLHTLKCHFTGSFYSTFLPSSVAIDIVRGYLLSRSTNPSVVWGATWVCKVMYLLGWILFCLGGLVALGGSVAGYNLYPVVGGLAAIVILCISLSFSKRLSAPLRQPISRLLGTRIAHRLSEIRQSIYLYRTHAPSLVLTALVTLTIHLIAIIGTAFLIFGVSGSLFLEECFLFIPLVDMTTILVPLTPNGLGIREALYDVLFGYLQLSDEQLAVFILLSALSYVLRVTGVLTVLWDRLRGHETSSIPGQDVARPDTLD
ncbi:MAG: flippase-like domain-containing protein [Gemmatimonadetes bacterium]|nr:flippase-like domain-containing protein [Gemmatimonadota bacterium]MBT6146444.1 flippase-like domain-containing protein [Gemmatimonadota bacterium]MBT7859545.1 flippase-like domain-containing protein [Gemmatimonadota bacterium]